MRRLILITCILALLLVSIAPAFAQTDATAQYYGQTIYVVQRGDSLASIARWYGTTVQAIASANGIWNPNFIYPGQQLIIPTGGNPQPPPPSQNFYIVRRGDTLAGIARYFGTTVWAIAQANNIQNINWIYTGMYLVIPNGGGYPPPQPPPQQNVIPYTVKPGDTLARIAATYGSTVQLIVSYNGILNPNRIYWGMLLYIPVY